MSVLCSRRAFRKRRAQPGVARILESAPRMRAVPLAGLCARISFLDQLAAARRLGMQGRFIQLHGPLLWRVRREAGRYWLGRAPAAFGVWMAR